MKKEDLPYNPQTMTVVIIDDQDPIRKAIRRIVHGLGFGNILEYPDGADALKILGKKQIDLVITDIYMRKVDGFALLKKVRALNFGADVPILVVTGESSKEDIIKAVDLGADDYLLKPFQISDFEKKIHSVLQKYYSPPPILKLLREGDKLYLEDQFSDALKQYEAAERIDPKSSRAKIGKALVLDKLEHREEALRILRGSAEQNPTYYKNFAALADIFLGIENKQETILALRSELELNPKQHDRQLLLADLLQGEGDFLGAIEHFKNALIENPKSTEALLGSGKCYAAIDNNEKALYYFKRARRYHPNLTKALKLIMEIHINDGNPRGAIYELIDEIRTNPTRYDARILLAETHFKNSNFEEALKVIEEGLLRDRESKLLLEAKAKLMAETKRNAQAVEAYKKIFDLDPSQKNHLLYGESLLTNGQTMEAHNIFFAGLGLNGNERQQILFRLGETLKRLGYAHQPLTLFLAASKLNGPIKKEVLDQEMRVLLGSIMRRRGGANTKKAV